MSTAVVGAAVVVLPQQLPGGVLLPGDLHLADLEGGVGQGGDARVGQDAGRRFGNIHAASINYALPPDVTFR
ncbi:MAG: hypothetical protein WDN72_01385 [Alphaproteobacteria bacterium]